MSDETKVSYEDLPEIVSVDLPFFARSVDSAYSVIGGKSHTMNVIRSGSKHLQARFPTDDALRSYIVGENVEKGTGLLVKIRRKKSDSSNGSGDATIEIIGKVASSYVFEQPADFQFLPSSTGVEPLRCADPSSQFLEMIPRPFNNVHMWTKADALFDHESYERQRKEFKRTKAINAGAFQLIKFGDPIPTGPNEIAKELERRILSTLDVPDEMSRERTEKMYAVCKTLFDREPVWKRKIFEDLEPFRTWGWSLAYFLPIFCYAYSSGPFRGCLIRYGHDLTKDASSRLWQLIALKVKPAALRAMGRRLAAKVDYLPKSQFVDLDSMCIWKINSKRGERSANTSTNTLPSFRVFNTFVNGQLHLTVCELQDDVIFEAVKSMKASPTCNSSTGWFLASHYSSLRKLILRQIDARISQFEMLDPSKLNPVDGSSSFSSSSFSSSSSSLSIIRSAGSSAHVTDTTTDTAATVVASAVSSSSSSSSSSTSAVAGEERSEVLSVLPVHTLSPSSSSSAIALTAAAAVAHEASRKKNSMSDEAIAAIISDADQDTATILHRHLQWTVQLQSLEKNRQFATSDEMHLDALVEERRKNRMHKKSSKFHRSVLRGAVKTARANLGLPVRETTSYARRVAKPAAAAADPGSAAAVGVAVAARTVATRRTAPSAAGARTTATTTDTAAVRRKRGQSSSSSTAAASDQRQPSGATGMKKRSRNSEAEVERTQIDLLQSAPEGFYLRAAAPAVALPTEESLRQVQAFSFFEEEEEDDGEEAEEEEEGEDGNEGGNEDGGGGNDAEELFDFIDDLDTSGGYIEGEEEGDDAGDDDQVDDDDDDDDYLSGDDDVEYQEDDYLVAGTDATTAAAAGSRGNNNDTDQSRGGGGDDDCDQVEKPPPREGEEVKDGEYEDNADDDSDDDAVVANADEEAQQDDDEEVGEEEHGDDENVSDCDDDVEGEEEEEEDEDNADDDSDIDDAVAPIPSNAVDV